MLIGLAVPNQNDGHNGMMKTLAMIAWECGARGHDLAYLGGQSACIDLTRNEMFYEAQDIGVDYMLMMDTDGEYTNDGKILSRPLLQPMIDLGKDIVSGVVHQHKFPYWPCIFDQWTDDGLVTFFADIPKEPRKIAACGGAFVLISRNVIQAFPRSLEPGDQPFDLIYKPSFLREDVAFCRRCTDKGFEIWCDPRPEFDHLKVMGFGRKHFEEAKKRIFERQEVQNEMPTVTVVNK